MHKYGEKAEIAEHVPQVCSKFWAYREDEWISHTNEHSKFYKTLRIWRWFIVCALIDEN